MTNTPGAELVAAIQWLKNKHAANQYALGYMAECAAHEDHEIDPLEAILQAVVSGSLAPTSAEPEPVAYQVAMSDGRWGTIFHHPDKPLGDHRPLYAHPPAPVTMPEWVTRCCQCNRLVDTREHDEGGDIHGCQMDDGRWTCSSECWEEAAGLSEAPMTVETAANNVQKRVARLLDISGDHDAASYVRSDYMNGQIARALSGEKS